MRPYRAWRWAWQYLGPVFGLFSVSRVVDLTFQDAAVAGAAIAYLLMSQKVIWVVLAAAAFFFSLVEWLHKNTPLTIASTHMELFIESPDGRDARVVRTQEIRPNREDVTGYQAKFWADPAVDNASIPEDSIKMHVDHCLPNEQDHMIVSGTEKRWEVIHRFKPIPMPFYKLGLNKVRRVERYRFLNSYSGEVEWYDALVLNMYRYKKLQLTVYFHNTNPCPIEKCKGYWIARHGVVELNVGQIVGENGRLGVRLTIDRPVRGDTYRILWQNETPQVKLSIVPATAPAPPA